MFCKRPTSIHPLFQIVQSGIAAAGCFYLFVAKFIAKIKAQLPAFPAPAAFDVQATKIVDAASGVGKSNIGNAEFYVGIVVPKLFHNTRINAPKGFGFVRAAPNAGAVVVAAELSTPTLF
jgi:hypothetical protein